MTRPGRSSQAFAYLRSQTPSCHAAEVHCALGLAVDEVAGGVKRHVALSIIGADRMLDNGYYRAKVAQEKLIEASGIPYTIVRATQFMEFLGTIAARRRDGNLVSSWAVPT